jgi:NADPH-dependent 2,4-dienoyl-CoA reductase/sulfur reductase-like enzyme
MGPKWTSLLPQTGDPEISRTILAGTSVISVVDGTDGYASTVRLSNGRDVHADVVVSAIGVHPNAAFLGDEVMRCRLLNAYASVC